MKIDFKKTMTLFALIFFIMILPFVRSAGAASFCVSDAAGLQAALTSAAANGEDDTIRIVQGTYVGNFVYASYEANAIIIEGGYTTGCASRTIDPANTVLDGNGTGSVLVISTDKATPAKMEGLTFQNGVASNGNGGGIYINTDGGSLEIYGCVFTGNSAYEGGGVYADAGYSGNLTFANNTFTGNSAYRGGGVYAEEGTLTTLTNNAFTGNSAQKSGGGVYANAQNGTLTTLTNNTFYANSGGGVYANTQQGGTLTTLTNNTFYANQAESAGGAINARLCCGADNIARIYNNILWMNVAPVADLWIDNDGDRDFLPSPVELFNNDFDQSAAGTYITIPFPIDPSNLNKVDPLFVDAANCDLHLSAGSPCINAGDNLAPDLPETDKDGQPRIFENIVDMGAYEYQGIVAPTAVFSGNPLRGVVPLQVQFTDRSVGTIESREWNFGDGASSSERNPAHTYQTAGGYTVSLTVTGPLGTDTETKTGYVAVEVMPPVPDIKANGEDSLLTIMPGEAVDILVSLDPGSLPGQSFDWWIGAFTPFGNYWLTPSLTWVRSDVPIRVAGRGLFPVSPTSLLHMPLPVGPYMFFFLLDAIPDGMLNDLSFYDLIDVVCQPAGVAE